MEREEISEVDDVLLGEKENVETTEAAINQTADCCNLFAANTKNNTEKIFHTHNTCEVRSAYYHFYLLCINLMYLVFSNFVTG